MWKLVPAAGPGEPYRLLVGTDYVVGRRNCAILIQDDQSISRSHAVLTVSHPETTQSQSVPVPILTIKDTSKYGTFVNGSKMNGSSRPLQSGDRVNFGVFNSKFRVEYESLVVCSSCLDVAQKTDLNQAIQFLGGLVVNEWTKECTYLVMASVKVTVKTICALICGRPIIKPEFFEELIKAVQSRQQLPTPERPFMMTLYYPNLLVMSDNPCKGKKYLKNSLMTAFYPPVDEPSIGNENLDLSEHQERKRIFSGKTFIFLTAKQYNKLGPAVILGGGEAKLMTEGRKETSLLVSPEVCVVDVGLTNSQIPGSESKRNWTDSILNVLQSNDLRAIPEAEIGLAVIFMSTETYCNPKKQPGNKAVTRSTSASGIGPAISQSLAVDETIMPVAADTSTLYVADTEIEDRTGMGIEKTPQMNRREKVAFQDIPPVKENPSTSGNVNAGTLISRVNRTAAFSQKSHPLSPPKITEVSKPRECPPRQQSNSITNYFQVARKRERDEEGGETSVPKLAKLEERSSPVSKCIESTASSVWNSEEEQHQKGNNIQLTKESNELASDKTNTKIAFSENPASKKRKELDDLSENTETLEIVFESRDLDWKKETANQDQEAQGNIRKKRCLEAKENRTEEVNAKQREESKTLREDEVGSVLTLEEKSEFKQELPVLKDHNKSQDDSSNLPSRLLLTEFRSLVVSHPRQNSQLIGNTSCRGQKNFKMFKKVTYPGAGQLPYIIGGSDLVAHHARKNSELEDWLREELEEQNRRAREESLADDLFRYDPNVKRRR